MSEWYLGDDWGGATQQFFEEKLRRTKGSYNKAQYLRIKGTSLLKSTEARKRAAGVELLKRVVEEYPGELASVMYAFELMGDYYRLLNKYDLSELNYRKSISFYKENGRSGTSGIGDIKLAELILQSGQIDKYQEMYEQLKYSFSNTGGILYTKEDEYRYNRGLAQLAYELGMYDEARDFAEEALGVLRETKPLFGGHPQLDEIKVVEKEVKELERIGRHKA